MIIIQDSREQKPWDFTFFNVEQVVKKLDTGDYSIQGFEKDFCIERKMSTGEIAINLGSKNKTFVQELERMMSYKKRYLIFEFNIITLQSFPAFSGIPKDKIKYIKMSANYIISLIQKYESKYNLDIFYCNNSDEASNVAYQLMKEFYDNPE